jgi:predicted membrane protein
VKTCRPEFFEHKLRRKDLKLDNLVEFETEALCVMEAYIFKAILLQQKGNVPAYSFTFSVLLTGCIFFRMDSFALTHYHTHTEIKKKYSNVRFVMLNLTVQGYAFNYKYH